MIYEPSLFVSCLGVISLSGHIRSGGYYSCSGCREGICLSLFVQYHSNATIRSSFPYHHYNTGQCNKLIIFVDLVLCIALPFILLGVIGHVCHVCPVGSKQHSWLEDSVRLTVTLQYSTFPSLYVTHADIKYGAGKQTYMGSLCTVLLHCFSASNDVLIHRMKQVHWLKG
jgi:hypothetical protein